jgi:hypothetical protein
MQQSNILYAVNHEDDGNERTLVHRIARSNGNYGSLQQGNTRLRHATPTKYLCHIARERAMIAKAQEREKLLPYFQLGLAATKKFLALPIER